MSYAEDRGSGSNTLVIVLSVIGGIVLVGLLVCGGFAYFVYRSMGPMIQKMQSLGQEVVASQQFAYQFLNDLHEHHLQAAYDLTSQDFQKRHPFAEFRELIEQHPEITKGGPIEKQEIKPQIDKFKGFDSMEIREFEYRFGRFQGKETFARIKLVKEDDSFRVNDFLLESWGDEERASTARGTSRSRASSGHSGKKSTAPNKSDDDDDDGP